MVALTATPHRLAVIASSDINRKRQSVKNYQKLKKIKDMRKHERYIRKNRTDTKVSALFIYTRVRVPYYHAVPNIRK